jgi:hypothetical protein
MIDSAKRLAEVSDIRNAWGECAYFACWPRDAAAPRARVDREGEGDRPVKRGFEIDLYDLVADGRGWSRQQQIRAFVIVGGEKEVSKGTVDIFQGLLVLH